MPNDMTRKHPLPLIVNLAPTGMVPTKSHSPKVPLQPAEIIADVLECARVGISMVHIHARDTEGNATSSKEIYAKIIGGIREHAPELVICVSCSGRGGIPIEQRGEVLTLADDLKPDMASLTLASLNFQTSASVNAPDTVAGLAMRMNDAGIKPELEIFDLGMVNVLHHLQSRGLVSPPFYTNLLFGNLASAQPRFLDMAGLVSSLPDNTYFSMAGLGASQLSVAAMAVAGANGVRIGLEDNLWLDRARQKLASNQDLIDRVHVLADALDRPVMSPSELRRELALPMRR
jgi:3-keto-5-aminohexanoate cleavage enzyme